jgi:hypothetical protein
LQSKAEATRDGSISRRQIRERIGRKLPRLRQVQRSSAIRTLEGISDGERLKTWRRRCTFPKLPHRATRTLHFQKPLCFPKGKSRRRATWSRGEADSKGSQQGKRRDNPADQNPKNEDSRHQEPRERDARRHEALRARQRRAFDEWASGYSESSAEPIKASSPYVRLPRTLLRWGSRFEHNDEPDWWAEFWIKR